MAQWCMHALSMYLLQSLWLVHSLPRQCMYALTLNVYTTISMASAFNAPVMHVCSLSLCILSMAGLGMLYCACSAVFRHHSIMQARQTIQPSTLLA